MSKDTAALFRSSLSVPMFEDINKSLLHLSKTPQYQNYTDVVFSTLGRELEDFFGNHMVFKYRYKSKKSFYNNIYKDSTVDKNSQFVSQYNPYVHHDIIGMRLVVKNIFRDFQISTSFINSCKNKTDSLQRELFELQKQYYDTDISDEDKKILETKMLHIERYLVHLNACCQFRSLLKKINSLMDNATHLQKKIDTSSDNIGYINKYKLELETTCFALKNLNSLLNTIAGEYAIEEIFEHSDNLKKLGVFLNPDRQKYFSENSGYTSMHYSIESSLLPNWTAELQDRSSSIEHSAVLGHDELPGKKRRLIDLPANFEPNRKLNDILQDKRLVFQDKPKITSTKRKFLKDLNMVSPDYTIYCHNGYIKRFNQKENVHHYYNGVLRKHKEYSEKIDMILDDSQSEMFVPELDNNIYLNDSINYNER